MFDAEHCYRDFDDRYERDFDDYYYDRYDRDYDDRYDRDDWYNFDWLKQKHRADNPPWPE